MSSWFVTVTPLHDPDAEGRLWDYIVELTERWFDPPAAPGCSASNRAGRRRS